MERLTIEKIKSLKEAMRSNMNVYFYDDVMKVFDELLEKRNAEDQGLLLRLPCRVGDEVFVLDNHHKIIHPFEVKNIHLNKYELNFRISYTGTEHCLLYWEIEFGIKNIGKKFFLTKEEAEQALARMEKSHE